MDNHTHDAETDAPAIEVAQFRFGVIAPVIYGTHKYDSAAKYFKSMVPLTGPDDVTVKCYKTLEKWVAAYRRDGFDGLKPKIRSDSGGTRKLDERARAVIAEQIRLHPLMRGTQIHKYLREFGLIAPGVSVDTVQRYIHNNYSELYKDATVTTIRDRKAYEVEKFGQVWQSDTCYICKTMVDGVERQVYCISIIDDHTRMIVGAELFLHDNAANFQSVLKNAISCFEICQTLYLDNGSPYKNTQLSNICGNLGIVLRHTPVRDGASKGKIERHFRTAKETWLYNFDPAREISSFDELKASFRNFVHAYNGTPHRIIGMSPYERFCKAESCVRKPESAEWLDECFLNSVKRRVNRDATISLDGVRYDVPMQFLLQKDVVVYYVPNDMTTAFVVDENGKHWPIKPTDVHANSKTKRNSTTPAIDYGKMGRV